MTSATDNRTTELRRKLTELGKSYRTIDGKHENTAWNVGELTWWYYEDTETGKTVLFTQKQYDVMPEQAIAATLGSDASAVQLAERLQGIADEMRNMGASSMKPHELLACYAHEVDKVADSLKFAATLGNGTCEMEPSFTKPSRLDFMQEYLCSECGEYGYMQIACDDDCLHYCPNCGKKVK